MFNDNQCDFCGKKLKENEGINGGIVYPNTWCDGVCRDKYFKELDRDRIKQGA